MHVKGTREMLLFGYVRLNYEKDVPNDVILIMNQFIDCPAYIFIQDDAMKEFQTAVAGDKTSVAMKDKYLIQLSHNVSLECTLYLDMWEIEPILTNPVAPIHNARVHIECGCQQFPHVTTKATDHIFWIPTQEISKDQIFNDTEYGIKVFKQRLKVWLDKHGDDLVPFDQLWHYLYNDQEYDMEAFQEDFQQGFDEAILGECLLDDIDQIQDESAAWHYTKRMYQVYQGMIQHPIRRSMRVDRRKCEKMEKLMFYIRAELIDYGFPRNRTYCLQSPVCHHMLNLNGLLKENNWQLAISHFYIQRSLEMDVLDYSWRQNLWVVGNVLYRLE